MSDSNKLLVSPSPHIHSGDSVEKNMYRVIIALLPALIVSILFFGIRVLWVTAVSIFACMLFEWLISRFILNRKELTILDGSAILTGLLLAMNLPSEIPYWIVVIGALVAIGIGKMAYGGLGNNIFNPAIFARVLLLVSFPKQMTTYAPPKELLGAGVDGGTFATPLTVAKNVVNGVEGYSLDQIPDSLQLLMGQVGGSFGEVSAVALLIGFIYLLLTKVITWHIPVSILGSVFIFGGIMHLSAPDLYMDPLFHIVSGGMLLGAIYMATDYVTSPMSASGMILYGVLIGVVTMIIRLFGAYPEGLSFAILLMNGLTPLINRFMPPRRFGMAKAVTK